MYTGLRNVCNLLTVEPETKAAAAAAASIVTTSAFGGAQSVPPTVRRFKRTS